MEAAHLVIVTVIRNDIEGVDDIGVLESGTDAEFGRHLFLILFF